MNSAKRQGRILGVLVLVQLIGLILPFVMLKALYVPPGFLESAARGAPQIRWSLLLLLANGALTTGLSLYVYPLLRAKTEGLARWLIVAGVAWLILQAVDNTHVLSMLSLSERYAAASGSQRELFDELGLLASSTRRTAHYTVLLAVGTWMLLFYSALWRTRLVPWLVPAIGVVAATLHLAGVSLPVLVGYPSLMLVAPGLAVSHGALIIWLLAKGIAAPRAPQ
ncbi:MAG: DUF4386 domain-containing protein [Gemmatimonadaceae bacterium]|jgi:hypothetical protein